MLRDWKGNVEAQTGTRLTEAATQDRNGQSSNRVDEDGSGRKEAVAPIINLKADRIKNVKADAPARFEIRPNPGAKGEVPWYSHHNLGYDAVKKHGAAIDEEAKKQSGPRPG